jgi:hypothetical protein
MPDDAAIRLTLPPDPDLGPVASVAVRAAARQVAMPESDIERLRDAVVAAFNAEAAASEGAAVEVVLQPGDGRLGVTVGGTALPES